MKCYLCEKGNLKTKKIDYVLHGTFLGKFEAEVCDKCKEIFFSGKTSKKMTKSAKEKGLWGIEAKTKVGVVGNSLDIRITKKIADFLNLKKGTEVTIYPENKKRLIIEL